MSSTRAPLSVTLVTSSSDGVKKINMIFYVANGDFLCCNFFLMLSAT
jgi:hypothetical protein